nr:hypothetical protein [Tanacetum cinerariifolium]
KGFFAVETPLFEGMVVAQEVGEGVAGEEHDGVPSAGVVTERDVTLTRRVEHLDLDKIAQALEITKLKRRVKKLERRNKVKVLKLRRLQKVGTTQRVETSDDTVMDDVSNQERMIAEMDQDADVVLKEANEVADDVKDDIDKSTQDQGRKAESQAEIYKIDLDHADKVLSMQEDESELAEVQEAKEDLAVKRYQALKRKPQTEAQARKNMMIYLKNVDGFKMDYFKEMSYNDIQATSLARKVPVVDYEIIEQNNKPYYKIIRADDTHQLYISFLSLIRNFDRKDLEVLWSLVKERFATTKPKNFSDDFLLITLGAMFEKPDIHVQILKNQRNVHGPAKVKGWKLLESCGVQIITFTATQLILLVERKYPLTRFTLDQMLNVVRLEVDEESKVSLELLSFGVDAAKEFKEKHAKCLMLLVKDLMLESQINAAKSN